MLIAPALLGACDPPLAAVPPAPPGACTPEHAKALIGFRYGEGIADRVMSFTGARTIRVIHPGQIVTMDFRTDRVNVHVDARGRIVSVTCG